MDKIKTIVRRLFNSSYLDKGDVATVIAAAIILFKLPLDSVQQAAAVTLISVAYVIAHKISNADKP